MRVTAVRHENVCNGICRADLAELLAKRPYRPTAARPYKPSWHNLTFMQPMRSALLSAAGFAHGFSPRAGGVSTGPFASLNLGAGLGDPEANVAENRRRFARAAAIYPGRLYELSQVHGARARCVEPDEDPAALRSEEGDALIGRNAGLAVAVRTADCIPLLLGHAPTGDVAAVHAGWRGVEQRIASIAIEALGRPPQELVAAIGPHISALHFEVGEEVAVRLEASSDAAGVVDRSGSKPLVDLATILEAQLREVGVTRIDRVGGCTYADPARYFSYRRDGETGRHLAAIVARAGG